MGSQEIITIENDFTLIRFQNDGVDTYQVKKHINQGLIQFHFGIKGKAKFVFNDGNYALDLKEEKSLLFYNQQKELPLNLELMPNSWVISVIISIQKFHSLFSSDANHIPFLSKENEDKKYYKEENISPSMAIVLSQMFHYTLNSSIRKGHCSAFGSSFLLKYKLNNSYPFPL